MLAGAGGLPQKRRRAKSSIKMEERMEMLNELCKNGKITEDELLTGLTFVIAKKK